MKREVFFRLCVNRKRGGLVAVKEEGYIYTFYAQDGNDLKEMKFALEKNGTSYIRITEIDTGMCADGHETQKYTTYKSLVDFLRNDPNYINTIYKLREKNKKYVKILSDLILEGKIEEGQFYK